MKGAPGLSSMIQLRQNKMMIYSLIKKLTSITRSLSGLKGHTGLELTKSHLRSSEWPIWKSFNWSRTNNGSLASIPW